jgi:hypothetical protein
LSLGVSQEGQSWYGEDELEIKRGFLEELGIELLLWELAGQ